MNDNIQELKKKLGGIPANRVLLPMVLIFVILQAMIINTFIGISRTSGAMSQTQRRYYEYIQEASSIMGGNSAMSEQSSGFVLSPLNGAGEVLIYPLQAYTQELNGSRRADKILANFKTYDVSEDVIDYLTETANASNAMIDAQLHALALMNSVYNFADDPSLADLPLPELTMEEQHMPAEARLGIAKSLVFGADYQACKSAVSKNSSMSIEALRNDLAQYSQMKSIELNKARSRMMVLTVVSVVLLIILFVGIYAFFVKPINAATACITKDENISEKQGVQEFRIMSNSYNNLLTRRNALEAILRSAASTDTLTGLENRYAFETYSLDADEEQGPLGVAYFDVNYLKRTNDEKGHAAGDQLLIDSAQCIHEAFGADEGNNCFRIGGDEFVAILPKITAEAEIDAMVERFLAETKKKNVSIAYGCAFTEDISKTNIKNMLEIADARLYECKRKMHEADGVA
ncbi:MAG: GGDEF domain-containing protein [Firmicutes bacterium]|nr:GGDEF domain-containing protein [Bacillota bacterium]